MHPLAKNALKQTYGIPVYQEQVMRLSRDMCGFTGSEADTLRKAMGKKIPKLMKEMKVKFIDGAVKNNVSKEQAINIFNQLEDFANWAFNKSHSVCYALISYQTAYLKAHFPDCFMAALMTSDLDNIDRLSIEIAETEHLGLKVLSPDVNESFTNFAVVKGEKSIRFGLGGIKNVGAKAAETVVKERKKGGEYKTLEDFLRRLAPHLNKKIIENLIKAGALDEFENRARMYAGVEMITKWTAETNKSAASNQLNIFNETESESTLVKIILPEAETDKKQELNWEKELLGLYLSDHPLKEYNDLLAKSASQIKDLNIEDAGRTVRIGGIIQEVKKITTKSNQMMAFAQFEDLSGMIELVVFPNIFNDNQKLWESDQMLLVEGKINDKDGSLKLLVDRAWPLDMVTPTMLPPLRSGKALKDNFWKKNSSNNNNSIKTPIEKTFMVELPYRTTKTLVEKLKAVLNDHPGTTPVELRILQNGDTKIMKTKLTVARSPELQDKVEKVLSKS